MTTLKDQLDSAGRRVVFSTLDVATLTLVAMPEEDVKCDGIGRVLDAEGLPSIDPRPADEIVRVYIAGPMTGYPQWNFPAFDAARNWLLAQGCQVISPADLDRARGINEDTPAEDFPADAFKTAMRIDMYANLQCTDIYFIKGWENSTGAKNEMSWAQAIGLGIHFEEGAAVGRVAIEAVLGDPHV